MNNLILSVNELLDLSFDIGLNFDDSLSFNSSYYIISYKDFTLNRMGDRKETTLADYKKYLKRFKIVSTKKLNYLLKTKKAYWSTKHNNCLVIATDLIYPINVSKKTLKERDYIKLKEVKKWFLDRG